jgi:hypothetical protein
MLLLTVQQDYRMLVTKFDFVVSMVTDYYSVEIPMLSNIIFFY